MACRLHPKDITALQAFNICATDIHTSYISLYVSFHFLYLELYIQEIIYESTSFSTRNAA